MTLADLLYQAGFWQWVGLLSLASVIAKGVGSFRLWGDITRNKTVNKSEGKP